MLVNFKDSVTIDKSILTLGNFDGVHTGHNFLLDNMKEISNRKKLKSVLITFNPHTRYVTDRLNSSHKIITSFKYKIKLLENFNIDYISVIDFDSKFSKIEYDVFIEKIIEKYNPKIILLGYDNRFGFKGRGTFESLSSYILSNSYDITTILAKKFNKENNEVKSSIIKEHILYGNIKSANRYLGRNFKIFGKIVKGNKIGNSLGFPTANLELANKEQIIPKVGVYYVNFAVGKNNYKALCNIGYRPTFENNKKLSIETHIVNKKNIDLYNKIVEIEFIDFIRNEKKFESKELLIDQINKDIDIVKNIN